MLKRLKTADLNQTSKKSSADLDKKTKSKTDGILSAGDFVFIIKIVFPFVQIVASRQ